MAFRDRASTVSCEHESKKSLSCVFSCSLLCWKAREHDNQKAKMHVIVLASQKGGAGKTTLAAHLAIAAEAAGIGRAVLIDTDPQGSLSAWWNVRENDSPSLATTTIAELPGKTFIAENGRFCCRRHRHAAGDHRCHPGCCRNGRSCSHSDPAQPARPSCRREHCRDHPGRRQTLHLRRYPGKAKHPPNCSGHCGAFRTRRSGAGDRA